MTPKPHFQELPPLSLYVHIPWCVRKCPYCDFNSHAVGTNSHAAGPDIPESDYIDCLIEDLQQELTLVQGRQLQSIFFGGGTPSLFSGAGIGRILEQVEQHIAFASDIEITLEANPGTVEQHKFSDFRQAGVNRLSIGIQSFNSEHLHALGRIHNCDEAIHAVESARKAGFDNFNLDLMHGLPRQTTAQALADLQQAMDLQPSHLSWYQLTIETNTEFYSQPPVLPSEDSLADIQQAGEQLLAAHGFQQYEVSAYSLPGKQARHNLNYWQFGDYIGIGAGAHGKLTELDRQQIVRRWKTRLPKDYLSADKAFCAGSKAVPDDELAFEFVMNALRLNHGFSPAQFEQRSGLPLGIIQHQLSDLSRRQLLSHSNDRIQTTALGRRHLNSVIERFI